MEIPSEYNKSQIILNSGRLLFNAKDDAIILAARKAISLSSANTINLDADKDIILNSETLIHLGITNSENASKKEESILLGDTTIENLENVFSALQSVSNSLSKIYDEKGGGVYYEVNASAAYLIKALEQWKQNKEKNKSKKVKTV